MVVHNLHLVGAVVPPYEGDAPLAIDPDGVLACTTASQRLQTIAGWDAQILQSFGRIQGSEFPPCCHGKVTCHAPRQTTGEDQCGRFVAKAPDHGDT